MQLNLFTLDNSYKELVGLTQVCKICSKEKDLSLFHKHSGNLTGIDRRCKTCFKKDGKLRKELREKYAHVKPDNCDCCGIPHRKSLVVDHDHSTLKFRGWLCESCNLGIGLLGDDIESTEKALTYLRKHYER